MNAGFVDPVRRRRRRVLMLLAGAVLLSMAAGLASIALRDSIVFFFGPTELAARGENVPAHVRLGGLVAEDSVREGVGHVYEFLVTDYETSIPVVYQGALPDLFREGQGVVAEGRYTDGRLHATRILAKHDENYMPREVADLLKETGVWRQAKP